MQQFPGIDVTGVMLVQQNTMIQRHAADLPWLLDDEVCACAGQNSLHDI
jgi:hypothetical protein